MSEIRCVLCGSSALDPLGYKCGKCGGAIGPRHEQCYIIEETKRKLLNNAGELSKFGIRVEQSETLQKNVGTVIEATGLVLSIIEAFRPGTLRDCVIFLRNLAIPESEVLRLRLDEPEQVLSYYRMDRQKGLEDRIQYGTPRIARTRTLARSSSGFKTGSKGGTSSGTSGNHHRKKNPWKSRKKRRSK